MSRTKNPDPARPETPRLKAKVLINADMVGTGKITLLRLLGETGSISAAAREMGIGYRRAWFLLDSLQTCFAEPLFVTLRGGKGHGGAELTETGKVLIQRHQDFITSMETSARPFLDWLQGQQPGTKTP